MTKNRKPAIYEKVSFDFVVGVGLGALTEGMFSSEGSAAADMVLDSLVISGAYGVGGLLFWKGNQKDVLKSSAAFGAGTFVGQGLYQLVKYL